MLTISVVTAIIVISVALFMLLRNYRGFSHIIFSLGLLSTLSAILCDSFALENPDLLNYMKRIVFTSEVIMVLSWLLFGLSFGRKFIWRDINNLLKLLVILSPLLIVAALYMPIDDFYYSPEFRNEPILFLGKAGYAFNLILLISSIFAIVNLEATLKSSSGPTRWNIKYSLLGVGGILAMNIFYYSNALLYRSLNMNFVYVRSAVLLLSTLLIIFSIIRHKVLDIRIVVSRKVMYRSIALFVIGFYLLALGLVGKGLRYLGPEVGINITFLLGFVGAILVLVIILSDKIRRRAIVFINKNFYKQKYDYREQWLQFTKLISLKNSLDELLDSIVEGFIRAIGSRGAAVWLSRRDREEFDCVKTKEFYTDGVRPDKGVISFLREKRWVIDTSDPECVKMVRISREFLNESKDTSLVIPLFKSDELIGFVVLREGLVDEEFNYEDYDFLKVLASQAAEAILNVWLSEELVEAKEMEAMGRISSFIVHDLKNAASMLSLTAQNAEQHMDNPEFHIDAIRTVINSTEKINSIIEKLKALPRKTELHISSSHLGKCVKSVLNDVQLNGHTSISYSEAESVVTECDEDEIRKVLYNLISNAIDATNEKGEIRIVIGREGDTGYIRVSDNGCGMSHEFIREHLFKPFHTTKKKGLGIGLYQCRMIAEAHSGELKVQSQEGKGSDFTLYLPLQKSYLSGGA